MLPTSAFLFTVIVAFTAKSGAWVAQRITRNAGLVDPIWAWTLGGLAIWYAVVGSAPPLQRWLLASMGGGWGLRLGLHLWHRNFGKPEEWRYARFRARWGARAQSRMFWFFQFQNLFTLALSACAFLPVAYGSAAPSAPLMVLAVVIWGVAVLGETLADRQMERFRADPANHGLVCRAGLWRYSRHPNYFFESLHWLAYAPLAAGSVWGWATLGAPLVMAVLLLKVSGLPLLEAEMIRRKPGYADYMRSTSAFVPWPPVRQRQTS